MEKLIACCGLDCAVCDAQIATMNNDDDLRRATVEKWTQQFNATGLTIEMINCTGCRQEGVKLGHCEQCQVRICVRSKGFETCADCPELETCSIVGMIHHHAPEALLNLKELRFVK